MTDTDKLLLYVIRRNGFHSALRQGFLRAEVQAQRCDTILLRARNGASSLGGGSVREPSSCPFFIQVDYGENLPYPFHQVYAYLN